MNISRKTVPELLHEIEALRRKIADLEGRAGGSPKPLPLDDVHVCRDILSSMEDSVCMVTPDHIYMEANDSYLLNCGLNREDIIGRHVSEIMGQKTFDSQLKPRLDSALAGETVRFATWIDFPKAERRYLKAVYAPCRDNDGSIIGVVVSTKDETGQRQAEDALRKSNDLLRATERISKVGGWVWDLENGTMFWTDETYRIHGMSPDQFPAGSPEHIQASLSRYAPEDRQVIEQAFNQCIREGKPYDLECPFTTMDGRRLHIRTVAQAVREGGRIVKVLGNIVDITERKQADSALEAARADSEEVRARLAMAMDAAHLVSWEMDAATRTFTFDDQFYRMYGTTAEREGGNRMSAETYAREFVHPDDAWKVAAEIEKMHDPGNKNVIFNLEDRIIRRDGQVRHVAVNYFVIRDQSGRPVKAIGANQDITDTKRAKREQLAARHYLEALWKVSQMTDATYRELCDMVLEQIVHLTQSENSFFGFISEDEETMILHAWSRKTMADCRIEVDTLHFPIGKAGLWAQAVRERKPLVVNDYDREHPGKLGLPQGHVPLKNLLSVPIIRQGKVVALAATANKKNDYASGDITQIETFVGNVLLLLDKKKTEESLRREVVEKREAIHQFQSAFAANPALMAITSLPERRFHDVNESWLNALGFEKSEVLGKTSGELGLFVDTEKQNDVAGILEREGRVSSFELQVRRKDGVPLDGLFSGETVQISGKKYLLTVMMDITERKRLEKENLIYTENLKEMNTALKVLLSQRERERDALQEQAAHNLVHLVEPYLDKIVAAARNPAVERYVDTIRRNLEDSTVPLTKILAAKYGTLTGNEIRVANLIRQGKTSKEIADVLNVSAHTVNYYRKSIRRKIGVHGKKSNLRTLLDMMTNDEPQ